MGDSYLQDTLIPERYRGLCKKRLAVIQASYHLELPKQSECYVLDKLVNTISGANYLVVYPLLYLRIACSALSA